jgi:hypothetical protein
MKRHITIEQLSAYLDSALGFGETRELESHFEACGECNARLTSMRRVVSGLGRVERAVPPPMLAQQIRRQAAALPVRQTWTPLRALRAFITLSFQYQPGLRTPAAVALAFVVSLFLVRHSVERYSMPQQESGASKEIVKTYEGDEAPLFLPPTTIEVAGRQFTWTETNGFVQRGLEGEKPQALVDAGSPRGRALLSQYEDLEPLLPWGPIVLRSNLGTVELRSAPGRVLGFEAEPLLRRADLRSLSA